MTYHFYFLHYYQHEFLHQGLRGKTVSREGTLVQKETMIFSLALEFWYFEKSNNMLLFLKSFLYSNSWFSITAELIPLKGLNLKLYLFSRLLDLNRFGFVPRVGNLIVRGCQNTLSIDVFLYANSVFSITTGTTHSTEAKIENPILF